VTSRGEIVKRRTIASLTDPDIDSILQQLESEAKPRVEKLHRKARAGKLTGTDAWYQASYAVFSKHQNRDLEDFIRVTAFAYSWVSKIPTCGTSARQFAEFVKAVQREAVAKAGSDQSKARRELFKVTQASTGMRNENSMVVVSKVLHFWDPARAPMIDTWSRKALRRLGLVATRSYPEYWDFLDRIIKRSGQKRTGLGPLDYRKVDEYLFQLGKSTAPKVQEPTSREVKDLSQASTLRSRRNAAGPKKVALARRIYSEMRGQTPAVVIAAFVERGGLTPKGAKTYYYNLRKQDGEVGKGR
jgi:hypothetical protein